MEKERTIVRSLRSVARRGAAWTLCLLLVLTSLPLGVSAAPAYHGEYGSTVVMDSRTGGWVVASDGKLYNWKNGGKDDSYTIRDTGLDQVAMVTAATDTTLLEPSGVVAVLKKDGTLWTTGSGRFAVLGNGTMTDSTSFGKILDDVVYADVGPFTGAAIRSDGSLWMWGVDRGQIGQHNTVQQWGSHESMTDSFQTTPVKIMDGASMVKNTPYGVFVLKQDHTLWLSKLHDESQNSYNIELKEGTFYQILDDVVTFDTKESACYAVRSDGTMYSTGANSAWKDGATYLEFEIPNHPTHRSAFWPEMEHNVAAVYSRGYNNRYILKTDGSLWGRGSNTYLGADNHGDSDTYVKILDNVVCAGIGVSGRMAVTRDGGVWYWGKYSQYLPPMEGQPGTYGGELNYRTPVRLSNFTAALPQAVTPPVSVTLNLNGGTGAAKAACTKGELLTPPANPSKAGYYFAGWFKDSALTQAWNFDTDRVNSSCTLYAKWEKQSTATTTAEAMSQTVIVDGKPVEFHTYMLRDSGGNGVNFIRLRDVANVLNGTKAQFNVDWRGNSTRLDVKQAYTTQNGSEGTVPSIPSTKIKFNSAPVLTEGVVAPLESFLLTDAAGGGHSYFKLRDLGKIAGFDVTWDPDIQSIVIDTTKPYAG